MDDAGFGNNSIKINQRRYLGSKTKLLGFIDNILLQRNVHYESFLDLFAGTGVVANYFKSKANIIVNDILESNYLSYVAFFDKEEINLNLLQEKIDHYNSTDVLGLSENYFSINFSDTYFDSLNSKLIGYIREDIENLFNSKEINNRERAYLITSLIYSLDRIANTVGHYDAYRKVNIPYRKLILKRLSISETLYTTQIYKKDANDLARQVYADVVYIDPPYNSRQYSDSYHLLENIAEWKKQDVFGVAKKIDRSNIKSKYSTKTAAHAFSDLINNLQCKYILVSYNDMGTSGDPRSQSRITDNELVSALERRGEVSIHEKDFNQFTTGKSSKTNLKERVFFCKVSIDNNASKVIHLPKSNSMQDKFVKSPLNYTGGKYKLLPQITKYFPNRIETFYDIFSGGANVGINAKANRVVCIDKNVNVIRLLQKIKDCNFEKLNQDIEKIIKNYNLSQSYINGYAHYQAESSKGLGQYNKDAYRKLRADFNSSTEEDRSVLLLVLILYGFNNQIRFNSSGEFNLPVGKRDYNGNSRRNLSKFNQASNVKDIEFKTGDFRQLLNLDISVDDFIYLDPPYLLGNASYNESGGWTEKDERDLYSVLDQLDSKNIRFALSNVIEHKGMKNVILSSWAGNNKYNLIHLTYDYNNSNYQLKNRLGSSKEVLITNY